MRTRDSGKTEDRLDAILGRFSDAHSVIEVSCRAMEAADRVGEASAADTDEISTLRVGLSMLRAVYDDLDRAIGQMHLDEQAADRKRLPGRAR